MEIDGDVLIDTLVMLPRSSPCLIEASREALPTLEDLRNASPERLTWMKATLKRSAKTRR